MKLNDFVLESLKEIRSEVVNGNAWKNASKPVSELTESEIFELQSKYIEVIYKYGRILEFMETWKLFTNDEK